jgi:uncharacterized protein (TIGR02466 family)
MGENQASPANQRHKMDTSENQPKSDMLNSKEINLFPTQIWIFPPDEGMVKAIRKMERKALELRQSKIELGAPTVSGRGIWRMSSPHLTPDFKQATERIETLLAVTCKRLGIAAGRRKFDTWLNVNDPGSYHVQHQHSPNLLSGVFYLSDIQESGKIIFKDPRPARQCFRETQGGPLEIPLSTTAGGAAIFPSWLEHHIEENQTGTPTACIAFNLGELVGEH